jgi:hypothetical protein
MQKTYKCACVVHGPKIYRLVLGSLALRIVSPSCACVVEAVVVEVCLLVE